MVWNPPDPSDYVDRKLAEDDLEITFLYLPDGDPYEIRVFCTDGTPNIEEFWSIEDFSSRLEDLKQAQTEFEILVGPGEIPY